MSLSCSCDYEWDGGYGDWCYYNNGDLDFETLKASKRKRCVSCGSLIGIGSLCLRFSRYRNPYNDIEAKIVGFDWNSEPPIRIADHYHCEQCGEIYLNLEAAGFCNIPSDNMQELLSEYQEMTGFNKQPA